VRVLEFRKKERDLVAASHVCARWREILTSAPHLWTKVDFEHLYLAYRYLERSKDALIDVTIGKSNDTISGPAGVFLGATPWVPRMKSLCIQTEKAQIAKIAERLSQGTPNLQCLTIEGKRPQWSPYAYGADIGGGVYFPHNFLGRNAPSLQSLTFHAVAPGMVPNFPLPNLTHIDWITETAHVAIEELLDLFSSSPLLEVIRMHILARRQTSQLLKQVTLAKLRKLDWADCNGSISLIPCLIAPQLSELAIKVVHNPECQRSTLSSILPPDCGNIPLLLDPTALQYVFENGNRSYYFCYPGTTLLSIHEVTKDRTWKSSVSPWFSPDVPISFSKTRNLTIDVTGGCPPLDDIQIERFESLQRLELRGETDSLVPTILSASSKLSEIWIIPKGRYFALEGLAGILWQRKGAYSGGVRVVRILGRHKCVQKEIEKLRQVVEVYEVEVEGLDL
jgi:hypothetical protein